MGDQPARPGGRVGAVDVLVLRHGESTWNAEGRWQGTADPPLSAAGAAQARACASVLRRFGFVAVACSNLGRARTTADLLADELGLPPASVDPRLRERDIGEWSGLTDVEIGRRWPGEPARWRTDEDVAPPGGEAAADCAARLADGVTAAAGQHGPGPVLLVSHGGVLRALERRLGSAEGPFGNLAGRWFAVDAAGVTCGPRFAPPWLRADGTVSSADPRGRSAPRV